MTKFKQIKEFYFQNATYLLSDDKAWVKLNVDYKNGKYDTEILEGEVDEALRDEIARFTEDVLTRKHGTNFALEKRD